MRRSVSVCGFRSVIVCCERVMRASMSAHLSTGRLWPPADLICKVLRACFCYRQGAVFVASYVERVESSSLQQSQWRGAASNDLTVFLVALRGISCKAREYVGSDARQILILTPSMAIMSIAPTSSSLLLN